MIYKPPQLLPLGDSAITITFGDSISVELSDAVLAAARRLRAASLPGVIDVVPSYASLTVFYDALRADYVTMGASLEHIAGDTVQRHERSPDAAAVQTSDAAGPRRWRFPVRYDGEDLDDVARAAGLTVNDVIELHSSREYRVYVIGFVPGFAYLGTLDERLSLPRRKTPRTRVPAGSVAIAELQTAVYPSATPGGWHLIGTTNQVMFDPRADPPALLCIGDRVTFEPVAD